MAYREALIKRVLEEKAPIIEALIAKAKKGDMFAIKELHDRALGKPHQPFGLDDATINALTITWQK